MIFSTLLKTLLLATLIFAMSSVTSAQVGDLGSRLKDRGDKKESPPTPKSISEPAEPVPPKDEPVAEPAEGSSTSDEADEKTKLDRTDAKAVAKEVLLAYQEKDFKRLSKLSTEENKEIFSELVTLGMDHPRYQSIMTGSRFEAVSKWKPTEPLSVRYRGANTAVVEFGATREESHVVMLNWEDDQWCFEDVNFPSREQFRGLSKSRSE